jgi:hypothetical protein
VQLESMGRPTVVVATTSFAALARRVAGQLAFPAARIAVVEHPLGGAAEVGVLERADGAVEAVLALLTGRS